VTRNKIIEAVLTGLSILLGLKLVDWLT